MKKLFIALTLLIAVSINAQTFDSPSIVSHESELVIDFGMASSALDSAAADTSTYFSLEDYDGGIGNFATLYTNLTSGGTPKTDISIHGCETTNGTYVLLDTIHDAETDTGPVYTAFDLAGVRAKYYKVIIDNEDTGAALTGYNIIIRAQQKDPAVN